MARIVEWLTKVARRGARQASAPRVGEWIWVPSSSFMSHGRDDFEGGRAQVSAVNQEPYGLAVSIAERPGVKYNWAQLALRQPELRARFGPKTAHPDPDLRNDFND